VMSAPRSVLFVCEHGAAKSVLAASYFNALARRAGLSWVARARGTAPDVTVFPAVASGLAAEGVALCQTRPEALQPGDLTRADLIVSFDQPGVAAGGPESARVVAWDALPPVSADYGQASQAIFERVDALIRDLTEGNQG